MFKKVLLVILIASVSVVLTAANRDTVFNKKRLAAMTKDTVLPIVQTRYMKQAPSIDGKISFAEWNTAGAFTGFRNFMTQRLAENDMTVFCGYDSKNLYFLAIIPLAEKEHVSVKRSARDSAVYRDSSVEFLLCPDKKDIVQVIVNAKGAVFDRRGKDVKWNGKWQIAVGNKIPADLAERCAIKKGWFVEIAMPLSEFGVDAAEAMVWDLNVAKNGRETLTFAPVKKGFTEKERFAKITFAAKDAPGTALYSLGKAQLGNLDAKGRFFNPSSNDHIFSCDIWTIKSGSYIKDVTGFDQIVGKLHELVKEQKVEAGKNYDFSYSSKLKSSDLEIIQALLVIDPVKRPKNIVSRTTAPMQLKAQIQLKVEKYLSENYIKLNCNLKGLGKQAYNAKLTIELQDSNKKLLKEFEINARGVTCEQKISALKAGKYNAKVTVTTAKGAQYIINKAFEIIKKPEWLGNKIGISNRVPKPFTPLTFGDKSVSAWGRKYQWSNSLLPSSITSAGHELLAEPARVVVVTDKGKFTVPLDNFRFLRRKANRTNFAMIGTVASVTVYVKGWVEFDGLCWYEMTVTPKKGNRRFKIDGLYLEFPLKASEAKYYHAAPNRALNGPIKKKKIELPFQVYSWAGDVNRGLGFTCESLQDWIIPRGAKTSSYSPDGDKVYWRMHLVQKTVGRKTLKYSFGLQATPVKPLPKDYHSFFAANFSKDSNSLFQRYQKNCDFTTIWLPVCKFSSVICAPSTASDLLTKAVASCHKKNIPAIPYVAPDSITNGAVPEHDYFNMEWQIRPLREWKSGTVQTRCCMNSSYKDWMLWTLRNMVRKSGADGIYFDGGFPQACANFDHGCGWRDNKRRIRYNYPVRRMREFKKRIYMMLDEEVSKRACPSPLFKYQQKSIPKFFLWEHASGAVAPPFHGFSTALFCGEWFKGAIRLGKTYRELLTLDTFRPRYLSQPWGIPNFFLSIALDSSTGKSIQTEAILAYLLPQGGPLFMRYLNKKITDTVLNAKIKFNTRSAKFYPAWEKNKYLDLNTSSKDVIMGVWRHENGNILAVVGNCTTKEQELTIKFDKAMKTRIVFPDDLKLSSENKEISFKIKRNSFVMFSLEP